MSGTPERRHRTRMSALWAAYGDALGFISELTDERGLRRRTKGQPLTQPIEWPRRVGGRNGVSITLPAGCYSDDTQLRLATARAISGKGFDVEAFARVELPIWLCYALGGGRATKAAASNLARPKATWFANTFDGWLDAGGNGAAMRIQPHVWAAADLEDPASYLRDVLRNAVCTHGNVTALFGAVFHAVTLAAALEKQAVPQPGEVRALLDISARAHEAFRSDAELAEVWLPLWSRGTGRDFGEAWGEAHAETARACDLAARIAQNVNDHPEPVRGARDTAYRTLLRELNLYDEQRRGAGTLTAAASLGLCWIEPRPHEAMLAAANALGSDTDTIATMAGAVLGAAASHLPDGPILDSEVIQQMADRLVAISTGSEHPAHRYPDLLRWSPPHTQSDALGQGQGTRNLLILGLGPVREVLGEPIPAPNGDVAWQWLRLATGQTLLLKRRRALPDFPDDIAGSEETTARGGPRDGGHMIGEALRTSPASRRSHAARTEGRASSLELDTILRWLEEKHYKDDAIGYAVRRVINEGSAEQLISLVTALRERLRNQASPMLFG